jgi:hypothetical protein
MDLLDERMISFRFINDMSSYMQCYKFSKQILLMVPLQ